MAALTGADDSLLPPRGTPTSSHVQSDPPRTATPQLQPYAALARLPPELLEMIFHELWISSRDRWLYLNPPYTISRMFVPYMRRTLYRWIHVRHFDQFALLVRTISSSRDTIAPLVESMIISNDDEEEYKYRPTSFSSSNSLQTFFGSMTNLTWLGLTGSYLSPEVADVILSNDFGSSHLRNLRHLKLQNNFNVWEHPCDYAEYQALNAFPSLKSLEICSWSHGGGEHSRDRNTDFGDFVCEFDRLPPNDNIKIIKLEGDNHSWSQTALTIGAFLAKFHSLEELTITPDYSVDYHLLLGQVSTTLTHLTVRQDEENEEDDATLDTVLPRFSNLQSLDLAIRDDTPPVLSVLHQLKSLRILTLRQPSTYSLEDILELFSGPTSTPQLANLILGTDSPGFIGEPVLDSEITRLQALKLGWEQSYWNPLTFEDAKSIRDLKATVGFEISGTMMDGIEIQERWDEEVEPRLKD